MSRPPKPVRYEKKPMEKRAAPGEGDEAGPRRAGSLSKRPRAKRAASGRSGPAELRLDLVQPRGVGVHDAPHEAPIDAQGARGGATRARSPRRGPSAPGSPRSP